MKTFQIEVDIPDNRRLTIDLPEDFDTGKHQVVLVVTPASQQEPPSNQGHTLNELSGKITSFMNLDAVAWQQNIRGD